MFQKFDYFVVFAEMRTGSNLLESYLNKFEDVCCHGEAFNAQFIGYPNAESLLKITKTSRDKDPVGLLKAVRDAPGLNGFRYFSDHDPRILEEILADPTCAKIILSRNPVESYVSWKIATATGQWKLTDTAHARSKMIRFEAEEFADRLDSHQQFQLELLGAMQKTGQTAFYINYSDLHDLEILRGLGKFLGSKAELNDLTTKLKRQNPSKIEDKVENFSEMERSLAGFDRFGVGRSPDSEPRRGPQLPKFLASARSPVLFQPIKSGPTAQITAWLSALDGDEEPLTAFSQKTLREWMNANQGFRSFSVLRHPVARAHQAFLDNFWFATEQTFPAIRRTIVRDYQIDLPKDPNEKSIDFSRYQQALLKFLEFVFDNLNGRTGVRTDAAWATQTSVLQGFAEFCTPSMVMREDTLSGELASFCSILGIENIPKLETCSNDAKMLLTEAYDPSLEKATRKAFAKDYTRFGFSDWQP